MDAKTAFLNGKIDEEVYIEQPKGFETHGDKSHVCKLKKALYGLKQAFESLVCEDGWIPSQLRVFQKFCRLQFVL